jgi:hypothetical protein
MQSVAIQAPVASQNIGTAFQSIGGYTGPAGAAGAIISAITLANTGAAIATVNVSLYNGTTDFYLAHGAQIAVGDTLVLGGGNLKIQLTVGWYIRVSATVASTVDATQSFSQFT